MVIRLNRSKVWLVTVIVVASTATAMWAVGSAFGSQWYNYTGDLTAGNAYQLAVPHGTSALQIQLLPNGGNATGQVALFGPDDTKVGVWKLDGSSTSVTYAQPVSGNDVLFVYSLTNAGLQLRIQAAGSSTTDLAAQRLSTTRNDITLTTVDTPQALNGQYVATTAREPVFATLLYSGHAENLAGTVASATGTVLTVSAETGTAYGPGLYGDVTGHRSVTPENLAPGGYTVKASASTFQGDLVLTFVYYVRQTVDSTGGSPPPVNGPNGTPLSTKNTIHLSPDVPTAITVPDGASAIVLSLNQSKHNEDNWSYPWGCCDNTRGVDSSGFSKNGSGNGSDNRSGSSGEAIVSVFDPSDQLLAVVHVANAGVTIPVPASGEYVVYVHSCYYGPCGSPVDVLAAIRGTDGVTNVPFDSRTLHTHVQQISLGNMSPFQTSFQGKFAVSKAPLALGWAMRGGLDATVMPDVQFKSAKGPAGGGATLLTLGGEQMMYGTEATYQNMVSGPYTFSMQSAGGWGHVSALVLTYERSTSASATNDTGNSGNASLPTDLSL
ncbi:MAG: hypothetical protein ACYDDF_13220 [Thermoplasmatota archaeon]